MATAADVERLRQANQAVETLALRALREFWASLDLNRPEAVRDALVEFLPALTGQYGEIAAVVAADWYDELREAADVRSRFSAVMASPVPAEAAVAQVRFGAQHLFTPTPQQTLTFLEGTTSKYVLQPGRDSVAESTRLDPDAAGWHRETRHNACKFCRMLAGRGGVYHKESTAKFAAHHHCHCVALPSWDPDAPQVPVSAYVASERTSRMTPAQREAHTAMVRDFLAAMD